METENYTKKDGSKGTRYILEKGDVIEPVFDKPRQAVLGNAKYPIYSIKARWQGSEIFVTLTQGQYKKLMGIADLEGKKLVGVGYEGPSGTELVGLDVQD